ncbi:MAG: tetratricopeptide repeat protein [Gemmatimonadaceae bacterium]|nr:tetratricopeptide repeat protein [Gemmatimonadaceae bacterium]
MLPHRHSLAACAVALLAAPVHGQTLADARTCERAITGSAVDRVAVQRAMAARPVTPVAEFAAGCMSVMGARWDSAAAQFRRAARGNPRSSAAFLWVGNITGQLARIGDAATKARLAPQVRDAYSTAIALDGTNIDAREGLMQYLIEVPATLGGSLTLAGQQAEAITRLNAFRGLGASLAVASAGHDNVAVERLLTQATVQFPDSLLGWANLSAVQADGQRAAAAFATITRWQARGTHRMFALFSLGRTAAVTGAQLALGEQALQQYLRGTRGPSDPPVANAHYRLGQIYERQKRNAEARAEYQAALRSNPKMRDAQVSLDRVR